MAMKYVLPDSAEKSMRLWKPDPASSLAATWTRLVKPVPVYAARSVSKLLPKVSKTAVPLSGAIQANQTEAPPCAPWTGSLVSRVAPNVKPLVVPLAPEIRDALAKASLNRPKPWPSAVDAIAPRARQTRQSHLPGAEDRLKINSLRLRFFNILSVTMR